MAKLSGVADLVVDSTATATFKAKDKAPTKDAIVEALKVLKWEPGIDSYASVERPKTKGNFELEIDGVG